MAKPRVPIPVARAVDALRLSRTLSTSFSSAGSIPIRAPLTLDDDSGSDSGTIEHDSVTSDVSNYSRELDFDSVSGDETALENVTVGRVRVNEEDEETSVNDSSLEEESENSDYVEGVSDGEVSEGDDGVSMKAKVIIPRAVLSLDDDEFDDVLGSDDEVVMLARVVKASGDEESEVEDEPECSDSVVGEFVSTEEEAVRINCLDEVEELSLGVSPGGSCDFAVENDGEFTEGATGLVGSLKEVTEEEVVQRSIVEDDDGGSIHEVDALMKPRVVEGVEDSGVEVGEMGMPDKPECSGSHTGGPGSTEEDMQVNEGNSIAVATGECNEFREESEGITDHGSSCDSQIVDEGVSEESIDKENGNRIDYGSSCGVDEPISPGEEFIGSGRRESEDGGTGNMTLEAKESLENNSVAVHELEKHESEIGMSSECFHLTSTLDSVSTSNLEFVGGIDAVSGCSTSDQKAEQEAEIEGKQESNDLDRKLSLPEEDRASSLVSFETANESVENGKQISEQIKKDVNFQSDSEPSQMSVSLEETSLLSVKDVERTMPGDSCVITDETHMALLIHNHTFVEVDEYERTDATREQQSESTMEDYSEELNYDHPVQLISEKVKERVEKSPLLKEKLQRIIRGIDLCSENSAVTEAVSKLSLASEHETSLERDYMSGVTKIMLPEQEFPDVLDFSINVLVIGKTGVGKSATINSLFGETKSPVGAFGVTTKSANCVTGNVGGVLIRILDTPGLMPSASEERYNQEVLMSIKKSMKTFPVDVVLYVDRLGENPDIHLLRTITSSLGSLIWQNTIVVLTHAASDLPESLNDKDFIAQRSSLMHQSIRQAVPELSKRPGIILAENNMSSFCGNTTNESTCLDWCSNLLISCCSVKMRSKADSLQKRYTVEEKVDVSGSSLRSFTLFCSLWNVLLLGANSRQASHLHDDFERKKRHILDAHYDLEHNQEQGNEERRPVLGNVRTRRGRLGFRVTKKFGIYLDTSHLHTGVSIGDYRNHHKEDEQQNEKIIVKMRCTMAVLGLVPLLISVFTSAYCPNKN